MFLKRLSLATYFLALFTFVACSSSDSADTTAGTGDGSLTTEEQTQVEAAASSTVSSAITALTTTFELGDAFQATAFDTCTETASLSGDISVEETDTSVSITFTEYDFLMGTCADESVTCINFCDDADFELLVNTYTNGTMEFSSDDTSFSISYEDSSTRTNYSGEESTVEMSGSITGTYEDPDYSITWTDFGSSVDGDSESADVTIDGTLTYSETTGLVNGELIVTVNGDSVTCTFDDYSTSSSIPPTCEL